MGFVYAIASRLYRPNPPVRDPKYLAYIREFQCIGCGTRSRPRDAMHTGPHGLRQKASDLDALPGCRLCHQELHKIGPRKWQAKHRVDFRRAADLFQELYRVEFPERRKQGEAA
jgi:hypothetical protein